MVARAKVNMCVIVESTPANRTGDIIIFKIIIDDFRVS